MTVKNSSVTYQLIFLFVMIACQHTSYIMIIFNTERANASKQASKLYSQHLKDECFPLAFERVDFLSMFQIFIPSS